MSKKKKIKNKLENSNNNSATYKKRNLLSDELAQIKNVEGMYNAVKKLPNPDIVLTRTGKGIETLTKLESDEQVATCITSRNAGVTSLKNRIVFNEKNEKYKEFYTKLLKKLPINDIIKAILNAPKYGFQPIEIVWQIDIEGFVVPKEITAKPQEWFFFDSETRQLHFKQKGCPDGILITDDMKKFLCPRNNPTYKNPYGDGYLSKCFWDTVFKKGSKEFWLKFIERYGMPWLTGKYERGSSDKEIDDLLDALEAMIQDAVAVFPDNSTIEIHETSGKSASVDVYKGLIDECNKSISKNILGQTLTTDVGNSGSYSLGQVHQQVRADIINSDKELVETEFNKLLLWIHELNFGDDNSPEFELYEEEQVDQARADRDTKISSMGVKFTKSYFVKAYGFSEDDIVVNETFDTSDFSEYEQTKNPQLQIDELIDSFSDTDLEKIMSEKLLSIIKNFAEVQNVEDAMENLAILFPEKDSKALEESLTKTIFLADIWGRISSTNTQKQTSTQRVKNGK